MEQLRRQNVLAKSLNRILGQRNTFLNLEKYFKEQKKGLITRHDP